jgi:hypothetical protein
MENYKIMIGGPASEVEGFRKALAELHKDKERLDFLESIRGHSSWEWELQLHDPNCLWLSKNTSTGKKTARESIDKAMRERGIEI